MKIHWNDKIESVESGCNWMIDCMDSPRGVVIFRNDSVGSDCIGGSVDYGWRDKSDVNERLDR